LRFLAGLNHHAQKADAVIFAVPATFLSVSPKLALEQGSFASKRALIAPITAPVRNNALEALQVSSTAFAQFHLIREYC
jgi:hypothetical protein